jgi:hypothetical protein
MADKKRIGIIVAAIGAAAGLLGLFFFKLVPKMKECCEEIQEKCCPAEMMKKCCPPALKKKHPPAEKKKPAKK